MNPTQLQISLQLPSHLQQPGGAGGIDASQLTNLQISLNMPGQVPAAAVVPQPAVVSPHKAKTSKKTSPNGKVKFKTGGLKTKSTKSGRSKVHCSAAKSSSSGNSEEETEEESGEEESEEETNIPVKKRSETQKSGKFNRKQIRASFKRKRGAPKPAVNPTKAAQQESSDEEYTSDEDNENVENTVEEKINNLSANIQDNYEKTEKGKKQNVRKVSTEKQPAMEPGKLDRDEMFKYVLNEHGGRCSLKQLADERSEFNSARHAQFWIEGKTGKSRFRILNPDANSAEEIMIIVNMFDIDVCQEYRKQKCDGKGCENLHICPLMVYSRCHLGKRCRNSHDVNDEINSKLLEHKGLTAMSPKEILKALRCINRQKTRENKGDAFDDTASFVSGSDVSAVSDLADFDEEDSLSKQQETKGKRKRQARKKKDREAIFRHIIDEYNGECTFKQLLEDRPEFPNMHSLTDWLRSDYAKPYFEVIDPGKDIEASAKKIMLTLNGAELCPSLKQYPCKYPCKKVFNECKNFHLCKMAILGRCKFGDRCRSSHNINDDRNEKVIKFYDLSSLNEEDILSVVKFQLNKDYKPAMIMGSPPVKEAPTSPLPVPQPTTVQAVNPVPILAYLLEKGGSCSVAELTRESAQFATSVDAMTWAIGPEGRKLVAVIPAASPELTAVLAYVQQLQICFGYCKPDGCTNKHCSFLHLCREFIAGDCTRPHCKYSHDVRDNKNTFVLRKLGLLDVPDYYIQPLICSSIPQVCMEYNYATGCTAENKGKFCTKFHFCADYVKHKCSKMNEDCLNSRNHAFEGAHNKNLVSVFGKEEKVLFKMLIVPGYRSLKGGYCNHSYMCPQFYYLLVTFHLFIHIYQISYLLFIYSQNVLQIRTAEVHFNIWKTVIGNVSD